MCDEEGILIPVYDKHMNLLTAVRFTDNLNLRDVPYYLNESENQGIIRIKEGKYTGKLVFMSQNDFYPSCNYARFITEEEAWERCVNRGKYNVIRKYDIQPEVQVLEEEGKEYEF